MDQVSSFLENILTVENEKKPKGQSDDKPIDKSKSINSILTDKLIERLINMIIPINNITQQQIIHRRLEIQKTRPPLSMQTMSSNAIKMNSRLTNVFIFIDSVIGFLNWTNPYLTIGVMLILTHLILNPMLLSVLPIVLMINNVMVPHYLMVYEPDNVEFDNNPWPGDEPVHDPVIPGPVPQFSQEFLINFTDLQNHMVYYAIMYDFLIWLTKDYMYFKNEDLSSLIYLASLIIIGFNLYIAPIIFQMIIGHFIVVQFVLLGLIWGGIAISYPSNREVFLSYIFSENTRISILQRVSSIETSLIESLLVKSEDETTTPLIKQMEIFELQKFNKVSKNWEIVGFTNDFYSINHPLRKLNSNLFKDMGDGDFVQEEDNISIPRSFGLVDVGCHVGYTFCDEWRIDLNPQTWVDDNLIGDLVSIDDDEKWVYDFYDDESEIFRRRRWVRLSKRPERPERPER